MNTPPSSAEIAAALVAQARAAHPDAPPAALARELRRAWQEGADGLGVALEEATAEARRVQAAYAAWGDAGALLDGAERAEQ